MPWNDQYCSPIPPPSLLTPHPRVWQPRFGECRWSRRNTISGFSEGLTAQSSGEGNGCEDIVSLPSFPGNQITRISFLSVLSHLKSLLGQKTSVSPTSLAKSIRWMAVEITDKEVILGVEVGETASLLISWVGTFSIQLSQLLSQMSS